MADDPACRYILQVSDEVRGQVSIIDAELRELGYDEFGRDRLAQEVAQSRGAEPLVLESSAYLEEMQQHMARIACSQSQCVQAVEQLRHYDQRHYVVGEFDTRVDKERRLVAATHDAHRAQAMYLEFLFRCIPSNFGARKARRDDLVQRKTDVIFKERMRQASAAAQWQDAAPAESLALAQSWLERPC